MVQYQNVFSLWSHPQKNCELDKGPFNNYVDKMRGEGGQEMFVFARSGYKNYPRRGGVKEWQNSVHVVVE